MPAAIKGAVPYASDVGGDAFGWRGDPSTKQQMLEMRRLGVTVTPGDNDVRSGIDTVYTLLASDRLRVFATCRHGIDELEGYVWRADPHRFRDKPVKQWDHLMDAVRYALHTAEKGQRMEVWM